MQHGYEFVTISIWLCRYFFTMCIDHVKPYTMVGTIWEMTTVIILTTLSLLSISQIIIHGNVCVSVTSKYTTVSPGIWLIDTANLKSFFLNYTFLLAYHSKENVQCEKNIRCTQLACGVQLSSICVLRSLIAQTSSNRAPSCFRRPFACHLYWVNVHCWYARI